MRPASIHSRLCARKGESTESENLILISIFVGFYLHRFILFTDTDLNKQYFRISDARTRQQYLQTYLQMALQFFVYVARELVTEFKVVNIGTLDSVATENNDPFQG